MSSPVSSTRLRPGPERYSLGRLPAALPRRRTVAFCIVGAASLLLWRLSLLRVPVHALGEYGLPPSLPVTWYAALATSLLATVAALTLWHAPAPIVLALIALTALILFGTVPALSAQPHYAWVYKHIGVVRYLEMRGHVNPAIDIYNRWPGFFALAAAFSTVAGVSNPASYAAWADLLFVLLDVGLLMAAVKIIAGDFRIAAAAGLLFVITNWVGQTYYSPQAFGYVLGMALLVLMFSQLRVESPPPMGQRIKRLIERLGRTPQLSLEQDVAKRWPRPAAITAAIGLDAVIVASHQLTPYMLLLGVALLMLVGAIRPWWLLAAMAGMTVSYLAVNFHFIQHNYKLFTSIDPFNNVQGPNVAPDPSSGKVFATHAQLLFIGVVVLATLIAIARLLRRGLLFRALPFVVLALSPLAIVFGQNYGGEASLRIILFAGPWCAALIAWAAATLPSPRLAFLALAIPALLFTPLFVISYLGEEELNIVSPAEARASERFYDRAPHGSVLVLAAPGFPYRYGASYPAFRGPEGDANPNLMTEAVFTNRQLGAAQVPDVAARIRVYAPHGYIAFSRDESAYAEVFRLTPPGALGRLREAVAASPQFRLWYANRDVQIYELLAAPARPRLGVERHTVTSARSRPSPRPHPFAPSRPGRPRPQGHHATRARSHPVARADPRR